MSRMYPPQAPPSANAGERVVFAAVAALLDAEWTAWSQVALPGRTGNPPRAPTPLRADFVLLGPDALTVIEVKGWRAASVVAADDSRITFRNGARAQHPLVQAYRYAAALAALLRAGSATAGIVVRYAAALPYVQPGDLRDHAWAAAFAGPRCLLADAFGPTLPTR
ncbi:MAG: NERD domain-containing protein, partial [Chloroflexota bacterium]|nr:NERD domain-containing protein [Chloroflexota bacterium]